MLYGALAATGAADETGHWGLLVLTIVLASAAAVERVLHGAAMLDAPRRLGLGNPGWRSPVLALASPPSSSWSTRCPRPSPAPRECCARTGCGC